MAQIESIEELRRVESLRLAVQSQPSAHHGQIVETARAFDSFLSGDDTAKTEPLTAEQAERRMTTSPHQADDAEGREVD